jgi:hypothetical protein
MTLRDFAVCASLRRLVIHRFIRFVNYSEAARSELRAFSFFALELGKAKSRE